MRWDGGFITGIGSGKGNSDESDGNVISVKCC